VAVAVAAAAVAVVTFGLRLPQRAQCPQCERDGASENFPPPVMVLILAVSPLLSVVAKPGVQRRQQCCRRFSSGRAHGVTGMAG
jgi:hypothetical protein